MKKLHKPLKYPTQRKMWDLGASNWPWKLIIWRSFKKYQKYNYG